MEEETGLCPAQQEIKKNLHHVQAQEAVPEGQKGYTADKKGNEYTLTEQEKDELLLKWKKCGRKPLDPPSYEIIEKMIVEEVHGATLILEGDEKNVLNFCTFDFLDLACDDNGSKSVKSQSKAVLNTY
eukprot:3001126-Ditylum_brightwellii.AAC.1